MDVRDSVYTLVDRVAGGAPIDAAANGLDLAWDHHGNHATDFLAMPGLWERLEPARLGELVDWFVAHGADPARMLEKSVSDSMYAGAGESPIRKHLLARTPLPDLRPALVAAFRARRLTLTRSLVERGADPAALAAWVAADLVTPATVDVRYQASDQEQRVTLTLRLLRLQSAEATEDGSFLHPARLLCSLGEHGLLGGQLFAPRISSVKEKSLKSTQVGEDTEVRTVLHVRGVAPAGLALVLRALVGRNLHWYPTSILLAGELELRGDEGSVDPARARSWFRDAALDPHLPPRDVPFTVTAKPKKKTFAVIEHRDGAWRKVHESALGIDPEVLLAPRVGFDVDARWAPFTHFDSKRGTTSTEVVLKSFGGGTLPDPAPLRAALLHALCALDGVTSVRWCDDAGAAALLAAAGDAPAPAPAPAATAPAKPAGKTRPTRPIVVAHPDRGPSRIDALRAGLTGSKRPWSRVGARAGAVPSSLGDAPLPPTLGAWLAGGDPRWPLPAARPLEPRSFADLMSTAHPDLATLLAPLGDHLLAGACVPLFVPSSCADGTVLFLHLPLADGDGEAPVLGFDPTDEGLVGVFASRFDHYLARVLGVDAPAPTFAGGPHADPYLKALAGRLPARERSRARAHQGVIAVGGLLEV